jgi:hypothetical protein
VSFSSRKNCLVNDEILIVFFSYVVIFSADAIERNQQLEFERNVEKLQIMKVRIFFRGRSFGFFNSFFPFFKVECSSI